MTGWRFHAFSENGDDTNEALAFDLPISDFQGGNALSGAGGLSGTITPEIARLQSGNRPVFEPWHTVIVAEADGQIRGCWLLKNMHDTWPSLSLDGISYFGYAQNMPWTAAQYKGVKVDPADVFRKIWDHIQDRKHGNLGLKVDDLKTNVTVGTESEDVEFQTGAGENVSFEAGPYKLNWWSTNDLSSKLTALAETGGFEFAERHSWDGESIAHRLELAPKLGRMRDDLRFVLGENILSVPQVDYNGDDYASEVVVLGAGEGRKMTRGSADRDTGRLRRVAIVTDKAETSKKSANKTADRELTYRLGDPSISQFTLRDTPQAPIGAVQLGDTLPVVMRGWTGETVPSRVVEIVYMPGEDSAQLTTKRAEAVGG